MSFRPWQRLIARLFQKHRNHLAFGVFCVKRALGSPLQIRVTPLFLAALLVLHFPSYFSQPPHVMSRCLSLDSGTKPEPLACFTSEAEQGSILLADARRTAAPLGHTVLSATSGPLGTEGDTAEADKGGSMYARDTQAAQADMPTQQRCTGAAVL